jgi:N-acyl-D-aspartate/D-glutamate deacylase
MAHRLVVRGGRVVDGTGMAGYTADVEVIDGRITAVGRVSTEGAEVIDAAGLVVAPGFIDLHTHFDAQLHFEPTASPASWHGVTTVVLGNCGFSVAPASADDVGWLCKMLSRVEGMSEEALAAGVTFAGGSMGDFLAGFDGKIGVNAAAYVGHAAVRRGVMGEAASERAATPAEVVAMAAVVRQSMQEGAIGFSTSQLDLHRDHLGRPVPPNLAAPDEIEALSGVLAEFPWGCISFFPRTFGHLHGFDEKDKELLRRMAEVSGKPIHGNVLGYFSSSPEGWKNNIAFAEDLNRRGYRFHPMLVVNPKGVFFSFDNTFLFDEYDRWREVLVLPQEERVRQLADPAVRAALGANLADPTAGSLAFAWDEVRVATPRDASNAGLSDRTIEDIAAQLGADPLDTMLDLAISEDLETLFTIRRKTGAQEQAVIEELIDHPMIMIGSSDGGAHLLTFCGSDYTTRLLTNFVPGSLTLERAVAKLTSVPAAALGLWDRGLIRPGFAGDLVLFDPARLAVSPVQLVNDFPAGTSRLVFPAQGYHATIVNGRVVVEDGKATGERPGQVLRGGQLSGATR